MSCAFSGIAGILLLDGTTIHSHFKPPFEPEEGSSLNISKRSKKAKDIQKVHLILIDEVVACHRYTLEAIDKGLQDILGNNEPFGGKSVVLGGDWRQTLPIVPRGSQARQIQMSLKKSYLWSYFSQFKLSKNMRVTGDGKFKEWRKILIKIGNGTMVVDKDGNIKLPKKFTSSISSSAKDMQQDAIDFVYQSINENLNDSSYFLNRAILCPHNDSVKEINDTVTQLFSAEEMISYSSDSTIDKEEDVPIEFLNTLNLTGLPQHEIILKKNMPVMLMRNINKESGLCNGTRLILKQLRRLVLELYNPKTEQNVCLPRFDLEADVKKCGVC